MSLLKMSRVSALTVLVLLFVFGTVLAQPSEEREAVWFNGPPSDTLSFPLGEYSMCVVTGADTRSSYTQGDASCVIESEDTGGGLFSGSGAVAANSSSSWTIAVRNMSCKADCSDIQGETGVSYFFTGKLPEAEDGGLARYDFVVDDYSLQGRVTCFLVGMEFPAKNPGRRVCEFTQIESTVQLTVDNAICEWICLDEEIS